MDGRGRVPAPSYLSAATEAAADTRAAVSTCENVRCSPHRSVSVSAACRYCRCRCCDITYLRPTTYLRQRLRPLTVSPWQTTIRPGPLLFVAVTTATLSSFSSPPLISNIDILALAGAEGWSTFRGRGRFDSRRTTNVHRLCMLSPHRMIAGLELRR